MMNEELIKRAAYFFKDKLLVHIKLKSGTFYNGLIKKFHEEFIIFEDRVSGELPIYFSEIERIERFNEK